MTPEIWAVVASATGSIRDAPPWLREQVEFDWEAVSALPQLDVASQGQHALPAVELKVVTPDYLDYLRAQISLNARGPEWLDLLRTRLDALDPYVGQALLVVTFYCKPHSATLRLLPGVPAPVQVEFV